jgi:hypothetical protein
MAPRGAHRRVTKQTLAGGDRGETVAATKEEAGIRTGESRQQRLDVGARLGHGTRTGLQKHALTCIFCVGLTGFEPATT